MAAANPNITDWLQGIGTAAAFLVTGGGLVWEARQRRLDRRDQGRTSARGVLLTLRPPEASDLGSETDQVEVAALEVQVDNYSSEVIARVMVHFKGGEIPTTLLLGPMGPGASQKQTLHLEPPFKGTWWDLAGEINDATVYFEVGGRGWIRRGTEEPKPSNTPFG